MICIEHLDAHGFKPAIRGMRNARQSWDLSDTVFADDFPSDLGPADESLMHRLSASSGSDRKFLRMIQVWADITAPLYWWKQFDTYKTGTTANSTSTMHDIMKRPFTLSDFSFDHSGVRCIPNQNTTVSVLNDIRARYMEHPENKELWRALIQLLPESYNQRRTVNLNYEVLHRICHERAHHKLAEWHEFCRFMALNLPIPWLFSEDAQ